MITKETEIDEIIHALRTSEVVYCLDVKAYGKVLALSLALLYGGEDITCEIEKSYDDESYPQRRQGENRR